MKVGKIELTRIGAPVPCDIPGLRRPDKDKPRKYTIPEIRRYLEGCRLSDGDGKSAEEMNEALNLAIRIIEEPDAGIEAVTRENNKG